MAEDFHPPVEEYLTTIYELAEDGVNVIQARLVERLGYSAPAVWEMVKRLKARGYLEVDGRMISLTPEGRDVAESVVRKHRLAERLLTDIIGLPWHQAHIEAGRWEHVISDDVEARLQVLLQNPDTCPHGNPIPGVEPRERSLVALSEVGTGEHVRLERVTETIETDNDAMLYLSEHHFITGALATVTTRSPDGTLSLAVGDSTVAVGPSMSSNLYVALVVG